MYSIFQEYIINTLYISAINIIHLKQNRTKKNFLSKKNKNVLQISPHLDCISI